jgi:hypothetical protein
MKKKLVSILLSLSMCASFTTPLMTAAADAAPAEDVVVEETEAPAATETWKEGTTSSGSISISKYQEKYNLQFGDTLNFVYDKDEYELSAWETTNDDDTGLGFNVGGSEKANATLSVELVKATDKKYLTIDGTKIKAIKLTSQAIPVKVILTAANGEHADMKLSVSVVQKDLTAQEEDEDGKMVNADRTKVEDSVVTIGYNPANEKNKVYKNLDEFKTKYKGKGLTVKYISDMERAGEDSTPVFTELKIKKDYTIKSITIKGQKYPATGETQYYTTDTVYVPSGSYMRSVPGMDKITGGAISNNVDILVEGKGNYKGTMLFKDQVVNLQTQRLNVNTAAISGCTVTFGSVGVDLFDGMTKDNFDSIDGESAKDKAKNYTFAINDASKKSIKIKDGVVTVKQVLEDKGDNRKPEITITDKKNKKCIAKVKFNVAPMDISTGAGMGVDMLDFTKITGAKSKYKNLDDFKTKFLGKDVTKSTDAKATKLAVSYTNPDNKLVKLKAKKDFATSVVIDGVKTGVKDGKAYVTSGTAVKEVVTTATIIIEGTGNYTGTITKEALEIPMEIQVVTGSDLFVRSGAHVKYLENEEEVNVYDYLQADLSGKKISEDDDKDAIVKAIKVKPDKDSGIKINKDGVVTVKKVDGANGKVDVYVNKNKDSADAKYTLKFTVEKYTVTNGGIIAFDTSGVEGKTFADEPKAKDKASKIPIKIDGKKKLKADTDYKLTVTRDTSVYPATDTSIRYNIKATFKGNYEGDLTGTVDCSRKASS